RHLLLELQRHRRGERRQGGVYLITPGQGHIPGGIVSALAKGGYLYGIFILPSTDVKLGYLGTLHRSPGVSASIPTSRDGRRGRGPPRPGAADRRGRGGAPGAHVGGGGGAGHPAAARALAPAHAAVRVHRLVPGPGVPPHVPDPRAGLLRGGRGAGRLVLDDL